MVATVSVEEANGGSMGAPTAWTVITSGRYATRDSAAPGDNDPCVVPTAGNNYSYWKSHRIAWTGLGTSIANIRWYTSGNIAANWLCGTGGGLFVCNKAAPATYSGCPSTRYYPATGDAGETGNLVDDVTDGHGYYKTGTSNYSAAKESINYVSATPLQIDTNTYTSITDAFSYHVVTQVKLATDATQGDKGSETLTFRYIKMLLYKYLHF